MSILYHDNMNGVQLIEWIQSGGAYDKPYTLSEQEQAEFDAHLEQMREKKRHKPAAVQQQ